MYIQDDWRVTDRLTVNAGLRWDVVTGFDLDQSQIPNFIALTGAAAAGRFNGVPGFEEFGKATGEDYNNWQPRIGAVYDLRGDGKDVIRAGWGVYYDFGYTNANILFPGLSVQGGSGIIFQVTNTAGIRNPDGSFFTVGQPVSNIAAANEVNPNGPFYSSNVAAPGIEQPWTSQTSAGWSHEMTPTTVIRRRLRAHRGTRPRRAVGAQHAHQRRRAPLCRPEPQPGQPDDEHERRREQVRRREHRRPPSPGARASRSTRGIRGPMRRASAGSASTSSRPTSCRTRPIPTPTIRWVRRRAPMRATRSR